MVIYRPGAVTARQIRDTAGVVEVFRQVQPLAGVPQSALPSPGVGLRHYAPRARLVLIDAPLAELPARLKEVARRMTGERVGVLLPADLAWEHDGAVVQKWGRWSAPDELARELYACLRALDTQRCTVILCPLPPGDGIGAAIRDRLNKAQSDKDDPHRP
jgi:L-threonylcarbamoyladenylate synthase